MKEKVAGILEGFEREILVSLTGWDYILSALTTVAEFFENGITRLGGLLRSLCMRQ